ncbi:MAG: hypothetical protein KC561_18695, partial [Myxococcales bacterium]|nr:hypothetical protein [Myxococcales bacterium]
EEASMVLSGSVRDNVVDYDNGETDEPVPLPWYENLEDMRGASFSTASIPFEFRTDRTVRFVVDEVTLTSGTSRRLVMRIQLGDWYEYALRPALYDAVSEISNDFANGELDATTVRGVDLTEAEGEFEGMDRLIGGMQVEIQ